MDIAILISNKQFYFATLKIDLNTFSKNFFEREKIIF